MKKASALADADLVLQESDLAWKRGLVTPELYRESELLTNRFRNQRSRDDR